MKKIFTRATVALLLIALILAFTTSCSTNRQAVMKSESGSGNMISLAMYSLMTSLTKGSLAYYVRSNYGDYNSVKFWEAVIDGETQMTYEEYYTYVVQNKAKYNLAALELFDELGLSLTKSELAEIDEEMADFVKEDGDGSKNVLNELLSNYGFNYDTLREYKIMNAKINKVCDTLYGGGDKIADNVKQEYFENHYIAFKQIMLPTYRYVYVTDSNGDDIYYRVDSDGNAVYYEAANGEKYPRIAYDTKNGIRLEVNGSYNKDSNGDEIYYRVNGNGEIEYVTDANGKELPRVAYDTVSGKRSHVYLSGGTEKTEKISDTELNELKDTVELIRGLVKVGDYDGFDDLIGLYDRSYAAEQEGSATTMTYLDKDLVYANFSTGGVFIDEYIELVTVLAPGEFTVYKSDYGYHIIMRYELESGAFSDSGYSVQFTDDNGNYDFNTNLCSELFMKRLDPYVEKITVDAELADKVKISSIQPNYNFY